MTGAVRTAALPLAGAPDVAAWLSSTLEGWGLRGGLSRLWLPALRPHLAAGAEVALELDSGLGLVSVEVRDAAGKVLVGLDDLVGALA